ncbi:MAG: hypothetical protein NTU79_01455 [Planctomycetota bacterium]|nr:hypothetical protein [Planctomycetota bacterium]
MNKLEASKASNELIRIVTKHPDGTTLDGIVLSHSRTLVVIREITGFEPDGVIGIPKAWIEKVQKGKREKCASEIIKLENTLVDCDDSLDFAEWNTPKDVIAQLQQCDVWPAVEVISCSRASLYMGPITEVSKSWFKLHCYDACGKWEKVYKIEYHEVFKIEVESKYVKCFNRYMRRKNGNVSAR